MYLSKNTVLVIMLFSVWVLTNAASAQTFTVLYNFTGGQDGGNPENGLTLVGTSNLYGTTSFGGAAGGGIVFKLQHDGSSWVLQPLHEFAGNEDGCNSDGKLAFGPDGSIYGNTVNGGVLGCSGNGVVFNVRPRPTIPPTPLTPWNETPIHQFDGTGDGASPHGDLVFDQSGNLYGTTAYGALDDGTVYQLQKSNGDWIVDVLHTFTGDSDGGEPFAGVTLNTDGNFYGTTSFGGTYGYGTVYKLSDAGGSWALTTLHAFDFTPDGSQPYGGLISDSAGNLYGTTSSGGTGDGGTVFELQPSGGGWTFTVLYSFTSNRSGSRASLVMDSAGNLYGTTSEVGQYGYGSVFKLAKSGNSWTYTSLHDFTGGSDGGYLYGSLALDVAGNIYGTTYLGGAHADGVVFEITP